MIKLLEGVVFIEAVEVDKDMKIIHASNKLKNFVNHPFSMLEERLRKDKNLILRIKDVEND